MSAATTIIKIKHPLEDAQLRPAVEVLQAGGLVAFPTETVYGLGAHALDKKAVSAIYEAKGRPADNPLIVHVANPENVSELTSDMSELARFLLERFTPGPLTLVLPRSGKVPDFVTAGLRTVAVRIPAHETALRLLQLVDLPIAAPSANRSGRPSPTRAWHVYEDLNGLVPYILDDGPCSYGLESTVLDVTGDLPVVLRPGAITAKEIELVTGLKVLTETGLEDSRQIPPSPGMKYRHYAPEARVWVARGHTPAHRAFAIEEFLAGEEAYFDKTKQPVKIGLYSCGQTRALLQLDKKWSLEPLSLIKKRKSADEFVKPLIEYIEYAEKPMPEAASVFLFSALRKFDRNKSNLIIAEALPEEGLGQAYMNRLNKAAGEGLAAGGIL